MSDIVVRLENRSNVEHVNINPGAKWYFKRTEIKKIMTHSARSAKMRMAELVDVIDLCHQLDRPDIFMFNAHVLYLSLVRELLSDLGKEVCKGSQRIRPFELPADFGVGLYRIGSFLYPETFKNFSYKMSKKHIPIIEAVILGHRLRIRLVRATKDQDMHLEILGHNTWMSRNKQGRTNREVLLLLLEEVTRFCSFLNSEVRSQQDLLENWGSLRLYNCFYEGNIGSEPFDLNDILSGL